MIVVSTREFRTNQGKYLGMASAGEDVVLKSRGKGSFKLIPITTDDTLLSKQKFYDKIAESIEQAKLGESLAQDDNESVTQFIDRLLCTD